MDDIIVGFECGGVPAKLNLQAKRKIQISAADSDFADVLTRAVTTRFGVLQRRVRCVRPITLMTSADRAEANDQASLGEREGENWSAPGSGAMPI